MKTVLKLACLAAVTAAAAACFYGHWLGDGSLAYLRDIRITSPASRAAELLASGRPREAQDYAEFCLALPGIGAAESQKLAETRDRAIAVRASASYRAGQLARGFFLADGDEPYSLGAQVAADLTVVGDIRDLSRAGFNYATGREVDPLITAVSAIGLALTAASVTPLAPAAGAKEPLALLKAARRAGAVSLRMERQLMALASRAAKGAGKEVLAELKAPVAALRKTEGTLGMEAAIAVMKRSDSLEDIARAAKAAEKFGPEASRMLRFGGRDVVAATEKAGPAAVRGAARYGEGAVSLLKEIPAAKLLPDLARFTRIAASRTLKALIAAAGVIKWLLGALAAFTSFAWFAARPFLRLLRLAWRMARRPRGTPSPAGTP